MPYTTRVSPLSPDDLLARLRDRYPGLVQTTTWNARALRYNPGAASPHGVEFVTIEERDRDDGAGANGLDAMAAYRLSFGVDPQRFTTLFGGPPLWHDERAPATAGGPPRVDVLEPHPRYGWMSWAAVVNPSAETIDALWPLLDESYAIARQRHARRQVVAPQPV